jgi:antitoxin MazE
MLVSKWGNSLAVRLPKALVVSMGLKPGDELKVIETGEGVIKVAKDERRRQALDRLAARDWELPADYKFDRQEANSR